MKITVQLNSQISIEIEERDEMDSLHKAIVLSQPKAICDICGKKEGFYLTSNKDKEGNIYVNNKCLCGARSKLGRYKTGGYFWKDFEKYTPQEDSGGYTAGSSN